MIAHGPATRRPGLLITRPREQGEALAARITQEGGQAWLFPTIEIQSLPQDPATVSALVRTAHWLVFISANAVVRGWPWIASVPRLPGSRLAAVGRATAERLAATSNQAVLHPLQGADSEALLALPELASVTGQSIVIVRGRGGREVLKSALESRGARVRYLECYARALPPADLSLLDTALSEQAWISIQSVEALENLWSLAGVGRHDLLKTRTFLAPHPRIAEAAMAHGIHQIHVTDPGNESVLAFWKNHTKPLSS